MKMYFNKSYKNRFPNAEILSNTGLNLPSSANLKEKEIKKFVILLIILFKFYSLDKLSS